MTSTGNVVRILSGGFVYPHAITGPTTWSGTIDWSHVLDIDLPSRDIRSTLPVKNIEYIVSGRVLTIRYEEYMWYDCV